MVLPFVNLRVLHLPVRQKQRRRERLEVGLGLERVNLPASIGFELYDYTLSHEETRERRRYFARVHHAGGLRRELHSVMRHHRRSRLDLRDRFNLLAGEMAERVNLHAKAQPVEHVDVAVLAKEWSEVCF